MTPAQELSLEEYRGARAEVRERALFLHNSLNLGVLLGFAGATVWVLLNAVHVSPTLRYTFLLLLPIVFATLTFNYQANQMTLEAVAGFSDRLRKSPEFKTPGESWDEAYGNRKRSVELTSFLKVLPLLIPLLLPFVVIGIANGFPTGGNGILCGVDLALFAVVLANFWYKTR